MRSRFIKFAGLTRNELFFLFALKILAGLLLGWISYIPGPSETDYTTLNRFGRLEYQMMIENPKLFFTDIFQSNYGDNYGGLFQSKGSYWNDLKNNILIKILAFMNILSRGNYYINSLFFNSICFFGHIALYRVFKKIYPSEKWTLIIGCFLLPSALYYSSGINKDNVSFMLTGLIVLGTYKWFYEKISDLHKLLLISGFMLLFLIRPHTAIAMIPALIAWGISLRLQWKPARIFLLVPIVLLVCSFLIDIIAPSYSPLKPMISKRDDFSVMPANTSLKPLPIDPSTSSILLNSPEAIKRSLMHPYPWEVENSPLVVAVSLETMLYLLVILYGSILLIIRKKKLQPFIYFGFLFSLIIFLIIGLIVSNTGAIVRYRSLYYPFFMIPFIVETGLSLKKYIIIKNI